MDAYRRRQAILSLVQANGEVNIEDLAKRFAVSPNSVRNDLEQLAREGLVNRVRGGAVAPGSNGPILPTLATRASSHAREKLQHRAVGGEPGQKRRCHHSRRQQQRVSIGDRFARPAQPDRADQWAGCRADAGAKPEQPGDFGGQHGVLEWLVADRSARRRTGARFLCHSLFCFVRWPNGGAGAHGYRRRRCAVEGADDTPGAPGNCRGRSQQVG